MVKYRNIDKHKINAFCINVFCIDSNIIVLCQLHLILFLNCDHKYSRTEKYCVFNRLPFIHIWLYFPKVSNFNEGLAPPTLRTIMSLHTSLKSLSAVLSTLYTYNIHTAHVCLLCTNDDILAVSNVFVIVIYNMPLWDMSGY